MTIYLVECLFFQLVFLLTYEFLLKRETFFQWNRFYLVFTFLISWILPWVEIEALKATAPSQLLAASDFVWQLDQIVVRPKEFGLNISLQFNVVYAIIGIGSLLAASVFTAKLIKINKIKKRGIAEPIEGFLKIKVKNSDVAFSFFNTVFVGEDIPQSKENIILEHELVHVKQWHSVDLMLCEVAKIVFWFNPLIYLYQKRMSELHEFIADAEVAKNEKTNHYQILLNQVFRTQRTDFINQFYKQSLIKKRIVMLTKEKSAKIRLIKYASIIPITLLFLVYSSCQTRQKNNAEMASNTLQGNTPVPFVKADQVPVFPGCENAGNQKSCFLQKIQDHIMANFEYPQEAEENGIQGKVNVFFVMDKKGEIVNLEADGAHELLEQEAVRIIQLLPKMTAGKSQGKVVDVAFSLPIVFKL